MEKLSQFYIELATDAKKMTMFNQGHDDSQIKVQRRQMLTDAGISNVDDIISYNQNELLAAIEKELSSDASEWKNLGVNANNSTNNDIGMFKN